MNKDQGEKLTEAAIEGMKNQRKIWDREYATERQFDSSRSWMPSRELLDLEQTFKRKSINPKGWNVLDLACGNGRNSIYALKHWKLGEVLGIDFSEEALSVFRRKVAEEKLDDKTKIFEQSIDVPFPIPDNIIDLTLDIYGTINIRYQERIACRDEARRVLKKGGLLLAYLTSKESGFVKEMMDCTFGPEPDSVIFANGKFEKVFSEAEIKTFYQDFELVELRKHNFVIDKYPVEMFWVLLRKPST